MDSDCKMFDTIQEYEDYCAKVWKDVKKMTVTDLKNMSAEKILSICGQVENVPVDIKGVLKKFDISALPYDFTDIEKEFSDEEVNILGALITKDDNSAVLYNSKYKEDSHRARFTIAHELAHCSLHGGLNHIELRLDGDKTEDEIAANTFAGELLIPEKSLRRIIKELFVPTIASLADIFDVSVNVMKERIRYLGLEGEIYDAG